MDRWIDGRSDQFIDVRDLQIPPVFYKTTVPSVAAAQKTGDRKQNGKHKMGKQKGENRGQKTNDRKQKTEDKKQKTKDH